MSSYTLHLGDQVEALLDELALQKETTKAEIIRRALSTYVYLNQASPKSNENAAQILSQLLAEEFPPAAISVEETAPPWEAIKRSPAWQQRWDDLLIRVQGRLSEELTDEEIAAEVREARVQRARGKFAHLRTSSAALAREKAAEAAWEDRV
jgi:hypothetical protein